MPTNKRLPRLPKQKGGRPPKFQEPRRPITVTLPENILGHLASIDKDRARAIVKATRVAMSLDEKRTRQVEVVEVAHGIGIILVGPSQLLKKIEGLRLVEVAPLRFLLTVASGTSIDSLELSIVDLLDTARSLDEPEHSMLNDLRHLIRKLRRGAAVSKAEMLFVDTRAMERE